MQADIRQSLEGCANPVNNDSRKENEEKLRAYKRDSPSEFIYYMAQELNNPELSLAARHLAGVLFKNSVKAGNQGAYWFNFTEEQANELKKLILQPMADPNAQIRLAACSCVATVACLELPVGKWPDIIKTLWECAFNENINNKTSALKTIGYICEELQGSDMSKEDSDLVISALLETIKDTTQDEEILKITMEAVIHSLTFAEKIFEAKQGDIIIERVLDCAMTINSARLGTPTMMCLAEIVRLYYGYIDKYMGRITEITFGVMNGQFDDEIKTLAIEVWCSLCEEEIYLKKKQPLDCKNYIVTVFDQLLELMLTLLNSCDIYEDDDTDLWNTSTAAGCCLHLMAQNVGDQIIKIVIDFVENKIGGSAEWKDKYFGLIALGAILEGPSKEKIIEVLAPAMDTILGLYDDQSSKIRETTAWFFSRVAQNHCELLGTEAFFPKLYKKICSGLCDDTKIAWNTATIITEVAKNLACVEGQNKNILSNCYEDLIKRVITCAYREDAIKHKLGGSENKITIAGFDALYSLFEHSPPDTEPLLLQSLEHFYKLLKELSSHESPDDNKKDMQSFICVCIQTILNSITQDLQNDVAKMLVEVIVDWFKSRADVFEEGFLLLSAICSKFGAIVDDYVESIGPFIIHALKESDSSDTIKNACGLISDLCTMVESKKIIDGFQEYVPALHHIMINPKLQRDAKLGAVTAIGDTYIMTRERFLPFLDRTLELFSSAVEQCVNINESDDDLIDYVSKLQGALIESYTCIIQEVTATSDMSSEAYKKVEQYVPGIAQFCIICIQDKFAPSLVRVKEVAGLIGDLASAYPKKEYYPVNEIEQVARFLGDTNDAEAKDASDWIVRNMSNIIQN